MKSPIDKISFEHEYQGYYWCSDATEPVVLRGAKIDRSIFEKSLPFIVEAHFFCQKEKLSIAIRYIDDVYKIQKIKLDQYTKIERIMLGIQPEGEEYPLNFKLYEIWEEVSEDETDPEKQLLAGMATLQPRCVAFAGFTKNNS